MTLILTFLVTVLLSPAFYAPITSCDGGQHELPVYRIDRVRQSMIIDARWDKAAWKDINPVVVGNFIRGVPPFQPFVQVKMAYDEDNLYVIFQVRDRYVRCVTNELNGPVWHDSAVEFFFSPDSSRPENYFNLEVNCGGTALLGAHTGSHKPTVEDIRQIEVAHSLPSIVDPEIKDSVTWTLEYRIPLAMLAKYSSITYPKPGVTWRANFCKIAENNTNPHHMTWAAIDDPKPTFHMPQYFGKLVFN
jgi:hypothetical protein